MPNLGSLQRIHRTHLGRVAWILVIAAAAWPLGGLGRAQGQGAAAAMSEQVQRQAMFEAEDARAPSAADLNILTEAARSPSESIQRQAVRALGRLERPALVPDIAALLSAASASVRAEAANALGQAVHSLRSASAPGSDPSAAANQVTAAADIALARLKAESDPLVRGVLCRTLGRLPYAADAGGVQRAEEAIEAVARTAFDGRAVSQPALLGAAKGFESLLRLNAKTAVPGAKAVERLRQGRPTRARKARPAVLRDVDPDPAARAGCAHCRGPSGRSDRAGGRGRPR